MTPARSVEWICQGEHLALLADRAVLHPGRRLLAIADLHLGKATDFQNHGLPVPEGASLDDIQRLAALVGEHGARDLWILGDLAHSPASLTPPVEAALRGLLDDSPELTIHWTRGNHDRCLRWSPHPRLIEGAPLVSPPLFGTHEPDARPPAGTIHLCGHVHPALRIHRRSQSLRAPCFVLDPARVILPAFGSFTGCMDCGRTAGRRFAIIAGGGVRLV